jgi:peptidyl-prolyl cis-trans isomerase SurA
MTASFTPWRHARVHPALAAALAAALALSLLWPAGPAWAQAPGAATAAPRSGDYIVAIVNPELVTAGEVERRVARVQAEAQRAGARLPEPAELRRQVLDALIDERVIITTAREFGMVVDEPEIDRAVQTIARQNQLDVPQLIERLRADGQDYARFRSNLRDQIVLERMREREVTQRIRVGEDEIEAALAQQREAAASGAEVNIAQILITVAEGASPALLAQRRGVVDAVLSRLKRGEDFGTIARQVSEDGNRDRGGEIGLRPLSRLPDLFVEAVRGLQVGEFTTEPVRSGAGFHVLKLLQRDDAAALSETQTRARHILLRVTPQLSIERAAARLAQARQDIAGGRPFDELARQISEDGSAAAGGDLGWFGPGVMVPEFEQAMNTLPVGGVSEPVASRFGVHLIQVLDRRRVAIDPKQLREQIVNVLREQKFEPTYLEWTQELRTRAYIEMREPPL